MSELNFGPVATAGREAANPDREALLKAYDAEEVDTIMEMEQRFQHGDDVQGTAVDAITAAEVKTNGS